MVHRIRNLLLSLLFPVVAGTTLPLSAGRADLPLVWAVLAIVWLQGATVALAARKDLMAERVRPGPGTQREWVPADVTAIDMTRQWVCDPIRFPSKSQNSPFAGWNLKGQAALTLVGGKVVHDE